jgi:hypothetical protein
VDVVVWCCSSCCCGARRGFVDCRVLLQLLHVGILCSECDVTTVGWCRTLSLSWCALGIAWTIAYHRSC